MALVDSADGRPRQTLLGHLGSLQRVEFSADARTLLALDVRGKLRFWHVASGSELLTWPSDAPLRAFDISADGNWIALARPGELELVYTAVLPDSL